MFDNDLLRNGVLAQLDFATSFAVAPNSRLAIAIDPTRHKAAFEYQNHAQQGMFRMHGLAWVHSATQAVSYMQDGECVTLTCFGVWTKDCVHSLQQAAVQISTSATTPYVGIQKDSGNVSRMNAKSEIETYVLP